MIYRLWLRAALRRACEALGYPEEVKKRVLGFSIVDDRGMPVEYVVIDDEPLRYRRVVFTVDKKCLKSGKPREQCTTTTTEYYEYIDATYELRFRVRVPSDVVREFAAALGLAGRIGIMSRTRHGYGKFRVVEVRTVEG